MPEGFQRINAFSRTIHPREQWDWAIPNSPAFGDEMFSNGHLGVDLLYLPPNESFQLHTHPGHHILYVVQGHGNVTVDGVVYETIPGDVYMVEAELPHAVGAGPNGHHILSFGAPHTAINEPGRMQFIVEGDTDDEAVEQAVASE